MASNVIDFPKPSLAMREYTEKAYMDYSMYVINDRALPFIGDGLKPVQRRIVYTMSTLGITNQSKPVKSARTIGEVIAKYHPHGEQACYESMVLMAQWFSFRYPLIDGQGNWGAPDDPKSFAAMRYTECRLSKWAPLLLNELNQGTVELVKNYDGNFNEPRYLPAQVPLLLLNGSIGIAVGMATDVLPHNLDEVVEACVQLLKKRSLSTEELLEFIQGPDLPTGAQIPCSKDELRQLYESGRGTVRCRAKYQIEKGDIVVTELPYQSSPANCLRQIASQMTAKKLPHLVDIRDESDYEHPTRLVLVPRSNRVDKDRLMQHLFATTDLERSLKFNLNVIGIDLKPRTMSLREMLLEWLEFRRTCVTKRLEFRVAAIDKRLHTIEGFLIAFNHLDEVIQIVRESDDPDGELIRRFGLSEEQAHAILELRLRQLARLQEEALRQERDELLAERDELQAILNSKQRMSTLIRNELREVQKKYSDDRRTEITASAESQAFDEDDLFDDEPVTVILSDKGWVRSAKGHEIDPSTMPYREGDQYLTSLKTKSKTTCLFFDNVGRVYSAAVRELPSARGQGEPLTSRFEQPQKAPFIGLAPVSDNEILLATTEGVGFKAPMPKLQTAQKSGKQVVRLSEGRDLLLPRVITDETHYACITSEGRMLISRLDSLPSQTSGKGVKIIGIPLAKLRSGQEQLLFVAVFSENDSLNVEAGRRTFLVRPNNLETYMGERTHRGIALPKGFRNVTGVSVIQPKRKKAL